MTELQAPQVDVKIVRDPYSHTIPTPVLRAMLVTIAAKLEYRLQSDLPKFVRPSLGLVLMDPTVPWLPGVEAVLAYVAIGPEGAKYTPNALAKAVDHHNLGQDCGISAYVQMHRQSDGCFLYGHSAKVDETIVGASAQSEIDDRRLAACFAADFNAEVCAALKLWKEQHPDHKWRCNQNTPREDLLSAMTVPDISEAISLDELADEGDQLVLLDVDDLPAADDAGATVPLGDPEYVMPTHPAAVPPLTPRLADHDRPGYDGNADAG